MHSPPGCPSRLPLYRCLCSLCQLQPTAELPIAPAFAAGLPIAPAEHVLCYLRAYCRAAHRACIRRRAYCAYCAALPAANAGAMGSSAVGSKIAQNVFGRRDRQPGGECRRDGQLCSRLLLAQRAPAAV